MSDARDFAQVQAELASQTTRLSALEGAARRIRTTSAIISLGCAVAGLAIGVLVGAFVLSDELDKWHQIKDAHRSGEAPSIAYDHSALETSGPEVDLSDYVKRSEIRQVVVSIMEQISTAGRSSSAVLIEAELMKVAGAESCVHSRSEFAARAKRNLDHSGSAIVTLSELQSHLDRLMKDGLISESRGLIRLPSDGTACP